MIDVKQAVRIAFDLLEELYDCRRFRDVLLEEVALAEDGAAWLVTLGFSRQAPSENIMEAIGSKKYIRSYKCLRIDAASGQLLAMQNAGSESGAPSRRGR
jgi:hypothetical protein